MHWLFFLILTAVFFGLYNFFIKVSAGHIHEVLGAVILQMVAFLLGGAVLLFLKWRGTPLEVTSKGVGFAILAGLAVGLAEITSFYAFSKGISASVGIPVIVGGTIIVGVLLGIFFLKESLTLLQSLGVLLVLGGIGLVTFAGKQ
jgi:transporter family protein